MIGVRKMIGGLAGRLMAALRLSGPVGKPVRVGTQKKRHTRPDRQLVYYNDDKTMFNDIAQPNKAGIKLARKAALGLVGLPHGRRGIMVKVIGTGKNKRYVLGR